MPRRLLLALIATAFVAACGGNGGASPGPAGQRGCDDGGSGGVMIEGVCL